MTSLQLHANILFMNYSGGKWSTTDAGLTHNNTQPPRRSKQTQQEESTVCLWRVKKSLHKHLLVKFNQVFCFQDFFFFFFYRKLNLCSVQDKLQCKAVQSTSGPQRQTYRNMTLMYHQLFAHFHLAVTEHHDDSYKVVFVYSWWI